MKLKWEHMLPDAPQNSAQEVTNLSPQEFADLLDGYGLLLGSAGVLVTPETAAKCIPVMASCALIAGGIVSMPIRVVRRELSDGRYVQFPADDHDYWWLLNESPNEEFAAATMWQQVVWDLQLRAVSYVRMVRESGGRGIGVRELVYHPASQVVPDRQWDPARRRVRIVRYLVTIDGRTFGVPPEDMLHFRGELAQGEPERSAALEAAREAIGIAIAVEQYSGRVFSNGGTPRAVIQYPAGVTMTPEQQDQLRQAWVRRYGGAENSHLPLVLANGGQVNKLSLTASELQMIESRKFQVIEIARAFRVPPFMIGETEKTSSWGSGIEQMSKGFIRYTLGPTITAIEQELNRKLFPSRTRYFVDFDEEALDKGDMKSLGDWYRQAVGGSQGPGFMTINEIRRRLNLPPVDGGDALYEPKGTTDEDAQPPAGAGRAEPGEGDPGVPDRGEA